MNTGVIYALAELPRDYETVAYSGGVVCLYAAEAVTVLRRQASVVQSPCPAQSTHLNARDPTLAR
jgi:hypothetical protein